MRQAQDPGFRELVGLARTSTPYLDWRRFGFVEHQSNNFFFYARIGRCNIHCETECTSTPYQSHQNRALCSMSITTNLHLPSTTQQSHLHILFLSQSWRLARAKGPRHQDPFSRSFLVHTWDSCSNSCQHLHSSWTCQWHTWYSFEHCRWPIRYAFPWMMI